MTHGAAALLGAIEAGGTKFLCTLVRGGDTLAEARIPTTSPAQTLAEVLAFFRQAQAAHGQALAFGVGSFGPLQRDPSAPDYGHVLSTPKPGWTGTDLLGPLVHSFGRPVGLDTDVNAAALAEARLGAGRGARSMAYVTVGTGIGGGLIVDGRALQGSMHPEIGHISVRRDERDTQFAGQCPFHGDCLEGLACGPAIAARWGSTLDQLGPAQEALSIIGGYLGQLAANLALVCAVERVIFGGGVLQAEGLLAAIRRATKHQLNGYLPADCYAGSLDAFIRTPGLGNRSGIVGAQLLAQEALDRQHSGVTATRTAAAATPHDAA